MRVAIDIDGVLADFTTGFVTEGYRAGVASTEDLFLRCEDVKMWQWPTEQLGWTHAEENRVWESVKTAWNWWMTLRPLVTPAEVDVVNGIIHKHDVYFITSRPRTAGLSAERQSAYWLEGIGIQAAQATVIATQVRKKGALANALDLSIALDDHLENLRDFTAHGVIAVARHWQYNDPWVPNVTDLHQFGDFLGRFVY